MTIKLCVFDMAGTTVDEDNVVYKVLRDMLAEQGYPLSLERVLEHGAGKEKHQALVDILTAETNCENVKLVAEQAFTQFKPALEHAYKHLAIKPIDGVPELFTLLRHNGISVVLNTGYSRMVATSLLKTLNWQIGRDIDGLVTASDVVKGRPAPDMIETAMAIVGVTDAQEVLKAGDSCIDVEEGKNAHCGMTIGVLSGAQTHEQIATVNPTHILQSLSDLPDVLSLSS